MIIPENTQKSLCCRARHWVAGRGRGGVRRTGQVFRGLGYVPCLVQLRGAPCKAMARAKGGRKGGWVGDGVRSSHSTELRHLAPLPFTAAASRAHPRVPTRCNDRRNGLFAADGAGLFPPPPPGSLWLSVCRSKVGRWILLL
jgi:hypothetical protein